MKVIFVICFIVVSMFASGFKYYIKIDSNMSVDSIINKIENVEDGTVIKFEKGTYNFSNKYIYLDHKSHISMGSSLDNKVDIRGLNIVCKNSNNVHLKNIDYIASSIKFENSKNSFFSSVKLYNTKIYFKNSTASITNGRFSNSEKDAIYLKESNIFITKSIFTNQKIQYHSFLKSENSNIRVINNDFDNISQAIILSNKSIGEIKNNRFKNTTETITIKNNSIGYIEDNSLKDFLGNYSYGILVKDNSSANIKQNTFSNLHNGIILKDDSKANIIENSIGNFQESYFILKMNNSERKEGRGISISSNSQANIKNNTAFNSGLSAFDKADKTSKVYVENHQRVFLYPGLLDPQVSEHELPLRIPVLTKFIEDFGSFEITSDKEVILIHHTPNKAKRKLLKKGFLDETILIDIGEYQVEIKIGTWMVINADNNMIIEPKKYKDIELKRTPVLKVSSKKRKIKILPIVNNKMYPTLLHFKIISNVKITSIQIDQLEGKLSETLNGYRTKPRYLNGEFGKHSLIIVGDFFEIPYECDFDIIREINCARKEKPVLSDN